MPADIVKFGDGFELDRNSYELRRAGRALKLERIPLDILFLLVERRGQLVTREDIIARIWGRDVFLDTDSSINGAIRKIRLALKDDPDNPVFLQTVTGKGYRFIAAVTEAEAPFYEGGGKKLVASRSLAPASLAQEGSVPLATQPEPGSPEQRSPEQRRPEQRRPEQRSPEQRPPLTSRPRVVAALGILLVVVVVAAAIYGFRLRSSPSAGPQSRVMLAVLPFANLSNDPEQEYFSDGLTEETITDLGELNPERLGVIARTSAASYKHTTKTIAQIGHELGVDYVLEGSVRREGGSARVSAQLIRVSDQVHLWAHNYDRETGGLLALQNELGRAIAQQVQVKLARPMAVGRPINTLPIPKPTSFTSKAAFT
jgi:TolB-like protein/DNA-binding winged helix-turn-helix (wHTH) protein